MYEWFVGGYLVPPNQLWLNRGVPKTKVPLGDYSAMLPIPGHMFENKYRIQSLIGSGGFAQVYLAMFEEVGREVAIKVLVPDGPSDQMYPDELDRRFLMEAKTLSGLKDPHTITLYDFGRSANGLLYMVFEFVDGTPLDQLVSEVGAIGQLRVLKILRQVLLSLREAHAHGILHRDIKPANIMVYDYLGETDRVKLLDFGIAKALSRRPTKPGEDLTRDGTIMGTPRYMSPEQICRQPLGPPSDLYSLGLVCFELLIGGRLIESALDTDVIRVHLGPEEFVLPPHVIAHPAVKAIVEKMVAKDFRDRYVDASACLKDVETAIASGIVDRTIPMAQPQFAAQPKVGPAVPNIAVSPSLAASAPSVSSASPVGFGSQVPVPSFGGQVVGTDAPDNLKSTVTMDATRLEIVIPTAPGKYGLIACAGAAVLLFFLWTVTAFFWIFGAVGVAAALGFTFASSRTTLLRGQEYKVETRYLVWERPESGATDEIVGFVDATVGEETHLVMKLNSGKRTLARGLSVEETKHLAEQANRWLQG